MLQFFTSEHAVLRRLALGTVNQFIVLLPNVSIYSALLWMSVKESWCWFLVWSLACRHDLVLGLYFLFYVYTSQGGNFLTLFCWQGFYVLDDACGNCGASLCSNHFKCSSLCSGIIHQHGLILARLVHFSQWQLTRSSEIGMCLELMKLLWSFHLKLSCSNVCAIWILMEGAMSFVSVSNSGLYFHSISLKNYMFFLEDGLVVADFSCLWKWQVCAALVQLLEVQASALQVCINYSYCALYTTETITCAVAYIWHLSKEVEIIIEFECVLLRRLLNSMFSLLCLHSMGCNLLSHLVCG